jgi:hypothetical protein
MAFLASKAEGNAMFTAGDIPGAIATYTRALSLFSVNDTAVDLANVHKNLAACFLKTVR